MIGVWMAALKHTDSSFVGSASGARPRSPVRFIVPTPLHRNENVLYTL